MKSQTYAQKLLNTLGPALKDVLKVSTAMFMFIGSCMIFWLMYSVLLKTSGSSQQIGMLVVTSLVNILVWGHTTGRLSDELHKKEEKKCCQKTSKKK